MADEEKKRPSVDLKQIKHFIIENGSRYQSIIVAVIILVVGAYVTTRVNKITDISSASTTPSETAEITTENIEFNEESIQEIINLQNTTFEFETNFIERSNPFAE